MLTILSRWKRRKQTHIDGGELGGRETRKVSSPRSYFGSPTMLNSQDHRARSRRRRSIQPEQDKHELFDRLRTGKRKKERRKEESNQLELLSR